MCTAYSRTNSIVRRTTQGGNGLTVNTGSKNQDSAVCIYTQGLDDMGEFYGRAMAVEGSADCQARAVLCAKCFLRDDLVNIYIYIYTV